MDIRSPKKNAVEELIHRRLRERGVISFEAFMEAALYHPESGYYAQGRSRIGKSGDFITSVSVGPLFGELLGFVFSEWLDSFVRGASPLLIEAGAGTGRLALDVLAFFCDYRPELFDKLEYWVLEPSTDNRRVQERVLGEFTEKVRWFDSWECIPEGGVDGVIFSNELLDALPVRLFQWDASAREWFEKGVTLGDDQLRFCRAPYVSAAEARDIVREWFEDSGITGGDSMFTSLPDGFILEVAQRAKQWWEQAAVRLRSGCLLTLDYGYLFDEYLCSLRTEGTLRSYKSHSLSADALRNPGEQDITASVNFSMLRQAGESMGLTSLPLLSQESFLVSAARRTMEAQAVFGEWTPPRMKQLKTLVHPEHFGSAFKVLIQKKDMNACV
ncbi:MAG: SAM-dependent methyltransferase [Verrucomicrobia bacterium]|nr:SAM-dependent methyltransferase [Verrucomicrobiota bacterium]MCF7709398.1 SAM-dependent methyltransferase [Verrucomicrobiota bacterium]